MQRFKHTFKRSKTPTGAEMKIQSSLEVPKQIRSASFDEMKLGSHNKRCDRQSPVDTAGLLKVPSPPATAGSHRSKSFDYDDQQQHYHQQSGTTAADGGYTDSRRFLEVPPLSKNIPQKKKSSGEKSPPFCVHCFYLDGRSNKSAGVSGSSRQSSGDDVISSRSLTYSDSSSADEHLDSEDDYADAENSTDASECAPAPQFQLTVSCPITTALALAPPPPPLLSSRPSPAFSRERPPTSLDIPKIEDEEIPQTTSRRRSITSPKLERQHALILQEGHDTSLESIPSPAALLPNDVVVSEFFLAVPDLKRDRAVSVDSCFIQKGSHSGKPEEVQPMPASQLLEPPSFNGSGNTARSRSVDIVLPTPEQARYKALSTTNSVTVAQSSHTQQTVPTTTRTTVIVTTNIG